MAALELSLCLLANDRSQPIIDGSIKADGVDFNVTVGKSAGEVFWRQLHFKEFDVAEMSFSDTLMLISRGDPTWVMLPVFMTRRFFHTAILVRADSGIEKPSDLRGKRVGLQEYVQTAHVWTRGIFQEEFGVHPDEIHWHQERSEDVSHCHFFGIKPPPKSFKFIPADKTVGGMMLSGELDAVLGYNGKPNMLDRSSANLANNPAIRPLFPKPKAEQTRYYQKTGLFPINHAPVIRRSILERHPWVALNIFHAFNAAKKRSISPMKEIVDMQASLGWLPPEHRAALDKDPLPYGIQQNQKVLETVARYSYEQGLSSRKVDLEEIFAHSTMAF